MVMFSSGHISAHGATGPYICPNCKGVLVLEERGQVAATSAFSQLLRCKHCSRVYPGVAGSFDFAELHDENEEHERRHYEQRYDFDRYRFSCNKFDVDEWQRRWHDPHWPECQIILRHLGDITDKVILCVGNGSSVKELYFACLGAHVIHSDLSFKGVLQAKARYDTSSFGKQVAFHAMSAYAIPLRDSSVDIVYGFEFVHHLPELSPFLDEARRVLKPGGICLFFDGAYSPLWQGAKMTLLWPLMKLSHLLRRRSPEDLRATRLGGYKEEYLACLGEEHGFVRPFFERTTFFHYVFVHGVGALLGSSLPRLFYKIPGRIGRLLDSLLTTRVGILSRSRIELIWGFERPTAESASASV